MAGARRAPGTGLKEAPGEGRPPCAHRNGRLERNPALRPRGQVEDPVREEPEEEEIVGLRGLPGCPSPGHWGSRYMASPQALRRVDENHETPENIPKRHPRVS
ncbi:hypothetical protein NDU88_001282 [Pleurodeles waltl]|uniref:Uncharacterized protein n=1 Tax=Pleurodeles waltl TaxID=8319 RepID=A0AAV7SZU2_PLEWA|nr:hypothetical protein NDU88_001282 [Pleurodeles waltl]